MCLGRERRLRRVRAARARRSARVPALLGDPSNPFVCQLATVGGGRYRLLALLTAVAVIAGAVGVMALASASRPGPTRSARPRALTAPAALPRRPAAAAKPHARVRRRPVGVATMVLHLVDRARTVSVSGHLVARSLETVIRYPTGLRGPFPLIVFGHGFAVSPAPYARLLDAWTRAGYVVAAPVFPLENDHAPGGPDEHDLVNQPRDMSLVISALSGASPARWPERLVDRHHIAVAGQSDGGDTALAVAYDPSVADHRVSAAIILSGAEDPFAPAFRMPAWGPPLLAVQGTEDTINPPWQTNAFFDQASRPKYLLKLLGAGHLPPYTEPGRQLTEVEHITLAFMQRYLRGRPAALAAYVRAGAGTAGPGSVLVADP